MTGSIWIKVDDDIYPRYYCCALSRDPYFCDLYAEKRPPGDCGGYIPPIWGWMIGDPHLTTLDGVSYTFNGFGEYTLATVDNGFFRLQGRTAKALDEDGNPVDHATIFVAFAAKEKTSSTVQVERNEDGTEYIVKIDGITFDKSLLSEYPYGVNMTDVVISSKPSTSTASTNEKNRLVASFSSGIFISIGLAEGMLDVIFSAPQEKFLAKVHGLLGYWDDDPSNDFVLPDGSSLNPTKEDGNFTDRDYFRFGQKWNVSSAEESLFTYASGTSWEDYQHLDFMPKFLDELIEQYETSTDPADINFIQQARTNCGDNQECLFDTLATGREDIGILTKNTTTQIGSQVSDLGKYY
ncbi:mucin-like protein, partial [Saccoglossus kowalevskii]